jgi:hypothetical protein
LGNRHQERDTEKKEVGKLQMTAVTVNFSLLLGRSLGQWLPQLRSGIELLDLPRGTQRKLLMRLLRLTLFFAPNTNFHDLCGQAQSSQPKRAAHL